MNSSHFVSRGTVRSPRDPGRGGISRSDGQSDFDDDAMAGPTQVDSESASRVAARRLVIVSQDVPVVSPEKHVMTDSAGSDGGASSG